MACTRLPPASEVLHAAYVCLKEKVKVDFYESSLSPPGFGNACIGVVRVWRCNRCHSRQWRYCGLAFFSGRDRDCVLVHRGYHTVSAPPGYDVYYLNVMAGPKRQWAFVNDPDHEWRAAPSPAT